MNLPHVLSLASHLTWLCTVAVILLWLWDGLLQPWLAGSSSSSSSLDADDHGLRTSILQRMFMAPFVVLSEDDQTSGLDTQTDCHYYTCFDPYRCGLDGDRLLVALDGRPTRYLSKTAKDAREPDLVAPWTQEFMAMLQTVETSRFYTSDPKRACLFLPAVDLLSERVVSSSSAAGLALNRSEHWWATGPDARGQNNLLLTMLPGTSPNFFPRLGVPHGRAMVAGAGLSTRTYRPGFDVALPTFSPFSMDAATQADALKSKKKYLLANAQVALKPELASALNELAASQPRQVAVFSRCAEAKGLDIRCLADVSHAYPSLLSLATFCLILPGHRLTDTSLLDAMQAGCVPVIAVDGLVLPFSEVLDWKRFSVRIYERELPRAAEIVRAIPQERVGEMRTQMLWMYQKYLSSIELITLTTLEILDSRIFPHLGRTYLDWNNRPTLSGVHNPLFLRHTPPPGEGFTAVVLTFNRWESLMQVISRLAEAPSLHKILVVWNNQDTPPPPSSDWPKLPRPVEVVQTKVNALSNRFYPYNEIETECVLSMDDDIVMLTADELEFGYQVWREFPDRLVGFPSRTHVWEEQAGRWRYESEWTSEISMVLTGAAFYHKYWHYLYTANPAPQAQEIRQWVDANMNCEDIAMNFLIANTTGQAPIKLTARKKFKSCPSASAGDCAAAENADPSLSGSIRTHMIERSDCVNLFAQKYGHMPLRTVEFRADPVLYKDDGLPERLKKFNNVDSL